jgi:hypothetical protein
VEICIKFWGIFGKNSIFLKFLTRDSIFTPTLALDGKKIAHHCFIYIEQPLSRTEFLIPINSYTFRLWKNVSILNISLNSNIEHVFEDQAIKIAPLLPVLNIMSFFRIIWMKFFIHFQSKSTEKQFLKYWNFKWFKVWWVSWPTDSRPTATWPTHCLSTICWSTIF